MVWMFAASLVVLAVCLARGPIAKALDLMDMPDGQRKLHGRPVPLVGGLAIMLPFTAVIVLAGTLTGTGWQIAIGLVGAGLMVLGALDDSRNIRPMIRLAVSAGLLIPAIWFIPQLRLDAVVFSGGSAFPLAALAAPFTVVCLLALQNGLNMADGMNGLAGSQCLCWSLVLAAHAPNNPAMLYTLLLMAAAIAVVLIFNLRGALFFGDAGSYSISVTLGLASIYLHNSPTSHLGAETILLLFAVPMIDMVRLVVIRLQAGVSPFKGDRNHLHHLLMERFGQGQALVIYVGLACTPSLIALAVPSVTLVLLALCALAYMALVVECEVRRLGESAS